MKSKKATTVIGPDEIAEAYRFFLNREPENDSVVNQKVGRNHTLETLRQEFVTSEEFQAIYPTYIETVNRHVYEVGGAVEVQPPDFMLGKLYDRVAEQWNKLGECDPYWSVLTDDRYRRDKLTDPVIEEFYKTGEQTASLIDVFCDRNEIRRSNGACFELGCGVGRVTEHLARRFETVQAADISAGNLAICRDRVEVLNLDNTSLVKLSDADSLDDILPYDVFISFIVLQHNTPPLQNIILRKVLQKAKKGAIGLFQTVSSWPTYGFNAEEYIKTSPPELEMHCLPMRYVFRALLDNGFVPLEALRDGFTGNYYGSTTFFALKERD